MQKAAGAENFETLLNTGYNDQPEYFYTTHECKMLDDKVKQNETEIVEEQAKIIKFTPMTRAERRRRNRAYKKHLEKLYTDSSGFPCGASKKETDRGEHIVRAWRGQRSKCIKKNCNRRFRRNNKLNMIVTRNRNIQHRATEFWHEYD